MTEGGFPIRSIRSNVDAVADDGVIFGRDCPEYEVRTRMAPCCGSGQPRQSQSGGGSGKCKRRAWEAGPSLRVAEHDGVPPSSLQFVDDAPLGPRSRCRKALVHRVVGHLVVPA